MISPIVLEIKLSRLAHLEVEKLKSEKLKLENERNFIYNIIRNEELFNQELIKGWREVASKFGDVRRTQIRFTDIFFTLLTKKFYED